MAVASSTRTMRPLSSSGSPIAVGSDTKRRTPSSSAGAADLAGAAKPPRAAQRRGAPRTPSATAPRWRQSGLAAARRRPLQRARPSATARGRSGRRIPCTRRGARAGAPGRRRSRRPRGPGPRCRPRTPGSSCAPPRVISHAPYLSRRPVPPSQLPASASRRGRPQAMRPATGRRPPASPPASSARGAAASEPCPIGHPSAAAASPYDISCRSHSTTASRDGRGSACTARRSFSMRSSRSRPASGSTAPLSTAEGPPSSAKSTGVSRRSRSSRCLTRFLAIPHSHAATVARPAS